MKTLLTFLLFPCVAIAQGINANFELPISEAQRIESVGYKFIRFQMAIGDEHPCLYDNVCYDNLVQYTLNRLDTLIANTSTIKFIIDLHSAPCGKNLFDTHDCKAQLVSHWWRISQRYKNNPRILGYDVINEPRIGGLPLTRLNQDLINAVRATGDLKTVYVTTKNGVPHRLYKYRGQNVAYTVHFYDPMSFTHQGIYNRPANKKWRGNQQTIRRYLREVINFRAHTGAKIFIGEFSVSSFAPRKDRINWIKDSVLTFKNLRFSYAWHAWGEAKVWDISNDNEIINLTK